MAKQVFEGLKVFDMTTSGVGPISMEHLAAYGATVIRVETSIVPCTTRGLAPFKDGCRHPDWSAVPLLFNKNKYAISLNLTSPKGLEIAWRFVKWCDVMGECFSSGVVAKLGLDYDSVIKVRPDIIYWSYNAQGQKGPHANWRGYGAQMSAVAGHYHFTGWPDRVVSSIYGAYNDFVAPRFGGVALIAALIHKKRTGEGQYIDGSQIEAGAMFMAPMVMDYLVNGRIQARQGNRVPNAAPHSAYRCQGLERWVAIAVTSDEQWEAFKKVIGEPEWAKDPKFNTLMGRKQNEDELDELVAKWACDQVAEEVMERMQQAGVPTGIVSNAEDLLEDPQLKHRGYYVELEGHPNIETSFHHDGRQESLSKTPARLYRAYGTVGRDNEYVYKQILGMSDEDISDCMAEGVFS